MVGKVGGEPARADSQEPKSWRDLSRGELIEVSRAGSKRTARCFFSLRGILNNKQPTQSESQKDGNRLNLLPLDAI